MTGSRPFVVAVDVGTSAVRAATIDRRGEVLRRSRRARALETGTRFDADRLWDAVASALRDLDADRPAALAISAHVGWVLTDDRLRPMVPAGGWADTTGVDLWAEAAGSGAPELLRRTGRPVPTGGGLPAAIALGGTPRWLLSPKDFLVGRITGVAATDVTNAAYSGAEDVRTRSWMHDEVGRLGIDPGILPPLHHANALAGAVTSACAPEIGVAQGTPVAIGGPDGTVGALHVLEGRETMIADVAGTTDVLVLPVDGPDGSPPGAVVNPAPTGGWTFGGSTGTTGGGVSWWSALLGLGDVGAALETLGAAVFDPPQGASQALCDTTMSGSRFPDWSPDRRGGTVGLAPEDDAATVLRAAVEGAAFVVRSGLDVLDPERALPIALVGGVARSERLARLRADITGRTVRLADEPDATLLGTARLAWSAVGEPPGTPRPELAAIEPDPDRVAAYDEVFERWRAAFGVSAPTDPR